MKRFLAITLALLALLVSCTVQAAGGGRWTSWAQRPWIPRDEPGIVAWYDAAQGITIATGVSQWSDISGNGNHLVQGTAGAQPTFFASGTPSGKPIVRFDGVNDDLQKAFTLAQPVTVFDVFRSVVVGAASVHDAIYSGGTGLNGSFFNDTTPQYYPFAGALGLLVASSIPAGSFHYLTTVFNTTSSTHRLDGTQVSSGSVGTNAFGGITLGASGAVTRFSNCDHAEFVAVSGVLSAVEIARIEFYVKAKHTL